MAVGHVDGAAQVVSGGDDGTVRVWDPATGAQVGHALRGHKSRVTSVAMGEVNGESRVVSGGDDGTVHVWKPTVAGGLPPVSTLASVRAVVLGADRDIYFATGPALCRVTLRNHPPG